MSEVQLREDLAAAGRLAARFGWQEAVANHISLAVSPDGGHFLMNRKWVDFARLRGEDLALLDANASERPTDIDVTAWAIHGTVHALVPQARCILHLHPPYATALSALRDPELKPIDQVSARFFNRHAIDRHYGGMADNRAEGERLAGLLAGHKVLLMGNHGLLTIGETVAEAFDAFYHFEHAARTLLLAYGTGQPLNVLADDVAEKTARAWESELEFGEAHFAEMKRAV
ncbi:MAG: class II aldolase/adducin family protein [Acidocella sp.]|nr:class II aldolase/adducin family protein [Acidocella sp.]MDR3717885.1 class II aldolase/adducin family protein [Bryobacteraceae bacterium]